jgi:flavin-dependent dehydrogenase
MSKATVIGAGPAGCVAALVLARAGVEVTLVEQHRFPRDKVCGECLSALAIHTLETLGIARLLAELRPAVLREASIYTTADARYRLPLPRPMWGISRSALDAFLLGQAVSAGARVMQPARCEGVDDKPGAIRVRDLRANEVQTIQADWVIVADGKGLQSLSPAPPTGDFGIKAHFRDVDGPRDAIELFGVNGAYGGLAAVEGATWNAAFSVPVAQLRGCGGNIDGLFQSIRRENPCLNRRMSGARRIGEWLASPLPRFGVRRHWPAGVIPVGNAAAAIEPIGGEGMGLAIASAELAARHLLKHGTSGSSAVARAELFSRYERLWRIRRAACRLAAMVVSRPHVSRLLLPFLNIVPATRAVSMSLLGKYHLNPSTSDMV